MGQFPIYEFGGQGTYLNLALANGITPGAYYPLVRWLLPHYRVGCLLPRALWPDESVPSVPGDWKSEVARDLVDGLAWHKRTPTVALGHSFGGIASMLAAIEHPDWFTALILLDPTILTHQIYVGLAEMHRTNTIESFPLVARARRRLARFSSRDEAYTYFRHRGIFASWAESAFAPYVAEGLVDTEDGVQLAWPPEWEAHYFSTGYSATWEELPKLSGLLPTLIIRGADSDTYVTESAEEVRQILPQATHIDLPGQGHMFPQCVPDEVGMIIRDWLAAL